MTEAHTKKILVVDDDLLLTKSLRDTLETDGYAVAIANSGQAGIDAFRVALEGKEPFAAVITDLGVPDMDGHKIAAAVKKASRATPVILLTGWGEWFGDKGSIPPNTDFVLNKPPKLRELREALARCLPSA